MRAAETQRFFEQLTTYVHQNVSTNFDASHDKLIDVLDSVGLLQLIMFTEQDFQIVLDPASLSMEVFLDLKSLSEALRAHAEAS
jgi:acyl carrier protein